MDIIARNEPFDWREHNARLRQHIASRAGELQGLHGFRWLIGRIKIEIWAWRRTFAEARRLRRGIE